MINYNQDAYGNVIYCDFREDISSATTLSMTLQPRRGKSVTVTPTLGTSDQALGDETLTANYYVKYTVTDGMFDNYVGDWRKKATAVISTVKKSTPWTLFRVSEDA